MDTSRAQFLVYFDSERIFAALGVLAAESGGVWR
jgi:hypothetical protein